MTVGKLWRAKEGSKNLMSGTFDFLGLSVRMGVRKLTDEERARFKSSPPEFALDMYGLAEQKPAVKTFDDDVPF